VKLVGVVDAESGINSVARFFSGNQKPGNNYITQVTGRAGAAKRRVEVIDSN